MAFQIERQFLNSLKIFYFSLLLFFGTANSILLFGKSRLRPHPPCVQICSRSIFVKKILIFLEMQITQKFPSSLSRQASKNAKRISVKKSSKSCCKSYWSINHSRSKALARSAAQCAHFFTILIPIQCDQKKIAKLSIKVAQKLLH